MPASGSLAGRGLPGELLGGLVHGRLLAQVPSGGGILRQLRPLTLAVQLRGPCRGLSRLGKLGVAPAAAAELRRRQEQGHEPRARVPHGVAVEIEQYEEEDDLTRIGAVIYCERKSHKGMIIGKGGRKLKGIGKSAREEIEALLGTKVYLETWVKVKENWRDNVNYVRSFGYHDE